jgi:hypothetical protein
MPYGDTPLILQLVKGSMQRAMAYDDNMAQIHWRSGAACDGAGTAHHGHCGAPAADILGQDIAANVYYYRTQSCQCSGGAKYSRTYHGSCTRGWRCHAINVMLDRHRLRFHDTPSVAEAPRVR